MSPILIAAIAITALGAIVFAVHRIWPSVTVKSAGTAIETEARKLGAEIKADLPDLEADAMAAGQRFLLWVTDTTSEIAAKAQADAAIARKDALAATTLAALSARAAATRVSPPPSA